MVDTLGTRIKNKYENPFRIILPQRGYVIIRVDGKAFHTFTRQLPKPHCSKLADSMDAAAAHVCKQVMGCRLAFGQSDEYSFLLTDFDRNETEMWFSGNVQKMASVSASMFTAVFNQAWQAANAGSSEMNTLATFDSRVFVIPNRTDVENYFIWRQADATRNSLNMLASCHYSHTELLGKGSEDKHEMLFEKGVNWNDFATSFKRGRVVRKTQQERIVSYTHKKTEEIVTTPIQESVWIVDNEIPVFLRERAYLSELIPQYQ